MNMGRNFAVFILLTSNVVFFCVSTPAVPHMHSIRASGERQEDGAFSPRGKKHHSAGEHHAEFDHEAILGSVRDAEEFDRLSVEESKRRLQILLTKMDLNKDGAISKTELQSWILRSFRMLSEEESHERFEDADENRDNIVTWSEYLSDTFGSRSNEIYIEDEEVAQHDKAIFDFADKNKDGALNRTEFLSFSHPEEYPEMFPLVIKQTLDEKDKNNDGLLDFKEFIGDRAKDQDQEWLIAEKTKYDEYDEDRDGVLNSNEIRLWLIPSNEKIAEEEAIHLFDECDDNADNVLSFDEILDHYDIFVGSEATDFGDHLQNIHSFQDEL